MPLFVPDYNYLAIHKMMLSDKVRTTSYCRAIEEVVCDGDVVVDIGSGTGILSMAAARAGAKQVYAIERGQVAALSERIIADNGLSDKITVIRQDSIDVNLPEKADMIVSEWMGTHVFQENMLPALIDARERFLKPGGKMLPGNIRLYIAPLRHNPIFHGEIGCWQEKIEGFSFAKLADASKNDTYIATISADNITHEGCRLHEIDLNEIRANGNIEMSAEFTFDHSDQIEGLCGWFDATLTDTRILATGPGLAQTHWQQLIYPCYPAIKVDKGDTLEIKLTVEPCNGFVNFRWDIRLLESDILRSFATNENYESLKL